MPKRGGRFADNFVESAAECAQAAKADIEADVRDALIGGTEEEHGAFDAPSLEIAVRSFAKRQGEAADEVRLGNFSDAREAGDGERFSELAIHCVSGAQHSEIALFFATAHFFYFKAA